MKTIVCGTDFSTPAAQAMGVAAAIAKRLGASLKLVHVFDELGAELSEGSAVYEPVRTRLRDQAAKLGQRFGIDVEPIALAGFTSETIVEVAGEADAGLIVVSSLGDKKQHRWLLGSVAERIAQASPIPVLVVRHGPALEAWARGERPLRVMVGVELESTSRAALRWAAKLRELGPCDLLVTQVAWPVGEQLRLGIAGPMSLDQLRPDVHELLLRDLRAWVGDLPGAGETILKVSPGWGQVDTQLARLALEAGADLLVVGAHHGAAVARRWQGSVSRGVLHHSPSNVACVPAGESASAEQRIPTFRRVLVPTDFSPLANRAIAVGYGLVAPGGVVHLLHVVTDKQSEDALEPAERLRALIPETATQRGLTTQLEVCTAEHAGQGIWQAAGRLGVDAICMATRGRTGLARIALGSQAQEVVQRARQPVLLVPPEREG